MHKFSRSYKDDYGALNFYHRPHILHMLSYVASRWGYTRYGYWVRSVVYLTKAAASEPTTYEVDVVVCIARLNIR